MVVALSADNSFTGGTTITSGALQLGAGGTTGSVQGNIVDNANLAIDRSDTVTVSNTISGTGGLIKEGSNTVILTSDNSFGGPATIAGGTLQLGNGGTSGTVGGDVVDAGIWRSTIAATSHSRASSPLREPSN